MLGWKGLKTVHREPLPHGDVQHSSFEARVPSELGWWGMFAHGDRRKKTHTVHRHQDGSVEAAGSQKGNARNSWHATQAHSCESKLADTGGWGMVVGVAGFPPTR